MKKFLKSFLGTCIIGILAVLLVACTSGKEKEQEKEGAFVAPQGYVSVVQVSINPKVNLYLDDKEVILAVEYVNQDAKACYQKVEKQLVGAGLEDGVNLVVETAAEKGYFAEKKEMSINVVDTKQEDKQDLIMKTATTAVKETLEEKQIEADVKVLAKGEAISQEKLDEILSDKPAGDNQDDNQNNNDNKDDNNNNEDNNNNQGTQQPDNVNVFAKLKLNTKYKIYKLRAEGELQEQAFTILPDRYGMSVRPFLEEDFGMGESVIFEGKTYYVAGGGGGGGSYVLTADTLTLVEDEISFTMNADGNLVVVSVSATEDFFVVGDILRP